MNYGKEAMSTGSVNQLGAQLRERRKILNLSAREVARQAGVDMGTVVRLELGQISSPRAENLLAIAAVLGIPSTDVFVMADWIKAGELPGFDPYLRAKFSEMPDGVREEMTHVLESLAARYGEHKPMLQEDEYV